jgi:hypothetical protein
MAFMFLFENISLISSALSAADPEVYPVFLKTEFPMRTLNPRFSIFFIAFSSLFLSKVPYGYEVLTIPTVSPSSSFGGKIISLINIPYSYIYLLYSLSE